MIMNPVLFIKFWDFRGNFYSEAVIIRYILSNSSFFPFNRQGYLNAGSLLL